jgi:hypothetical protein
MRLPSCCAKVLFPLPAQPKMTIRTTIVDYRRIREAVKSPIFKLSRYRNRFVSDGCKQARHLLKAGVRREASLYIRLDLHGHSFPEILQSRSATEVVAILPPLREQVLWSRSEFI